MLGILGFQIADTDSLSGILKDRPGADVYQSVTRMASNRFERGVSTFRPGMPWDTQLVLARPHTNENLACQIQTEAKWDRPSDADVADWASLRLEFRRLNAIRKAAEAHNDSIDPTASERLDGYVFTVDEDGDFSYGSPYTVTRKSDNDGSLEYSTKIIVADNGEIIHAEMGFEPSHEDELKSLSMSKPSNGDELFTLRLVDGRTFELSKDGMQEV